MSHFEDLSSKYRFEYRSHFDRHRSMLDQMPLLNNQSWERDLLLAVDLKPHWQELLNRREQAGKLD